MSRYYFHISNGHPFDDHGGEELPNDEAAWRQAVLTVRDIESSLGLNESNSWSLLVERENEPIFQIDVIAKRISSA